MNYTRLLPAVQTQVNTLFEEFYDHRYTYHNLNHTERVVASAIEIANHYQLNARDFFVVIASAWFHDVGYLTKAQHHEIEGADKAVAFLKEKGVPSEDLDAVEGCILSTRLPQTPKNLLEKIVCDADLYHLGTPDFKKTNQQIFKEVENLKESSPNTEKWTAKTLALLQNHHYHTDYCRLLLNDGKEKNIKALQTGEAFADEREPGSREAHEKTESKKKTKSKKKPKKGIETMFKVASGNNARLSRLADYKARNMITVNSIILSAIISLLLRHLDQYEYLSIPTYITLAVCVTSLIFSVLATRPGGNKGIFRLKDVREKKTNLMFFGNFYKTDLATYDQGMWEVMEDYDLLYSTMIRDVYYQGVVLGRKFNLLRYSYNIFMYGLIVAVLAFIIATAVV